MVEAHPPRPHPPGLIASDGEPFTLPWSAVTPAPGRVPGADLAHDALGEVVAVFAVADHADLPVPALIVLALADGQVRERSAVEGGHGAPPEVRGEPGALARQAGEAIGQHAGQVQVRPLPRGALAELHSGVELGLPVRSPSRTRPGSPRPGRDPWPPSGTRGSASSTVPWCPPAIAASPYPARTTGTRPTGYQAATSSCSRAGVWTVGFFLFGSESRKTLRHAENTCWGSGPVTYSSSYFSNSARTFTATSA